MTLLVRVMICPVMINLAVSAITEKYRKRKLEKSIVVEKNIVVSVRKHRNGEGKLEEDTVVSIKKHRTDKEKHTLKKRGSKAATGSPGTSKLNRKRQPINLVVSSLYPTDDVGIKNLDVQGKDKLVEEISRPSDQSDKISDEIVYDRFP